MREAVGESDGLFYFIMEYVDGPNLRHMIETGGLQPKEALAIVPQICEALQFAHDEGIVHRDIKPENILLDKKGHVKIADFGLAKLMGKDSAEYKLTGSHQVMGTPRYMAPEQMMGSASIDHRADIYSLGVVFYEMLTGELPMGRFAPPSKKVHIDVRLDEIVLRALENEPEKRYQQVSEVKTEIESICSTSSTTHSGAGTGDELERHVLAHIPEGKNAAIKAYRNKTGSRFKATEAVESIARKHGVPFVLRASAWNLLGFVAALFGSLMLIFTVMMLIFTVKWDVSPVITGTVFVTIAIMMAIPAIRSRETVTGKQSAVQFFSLLMFFVLLSAINAQPLLAFVYQVTGIAAGQHDLILFRLLSLGQLLWIVPTMVRLSRKIREDPFVQFVHPELALKDRFVAKSLRQRLYGPGALYHFVAFCAFSSSALSSLLAENDIIWFMPYFGCLLFAMGLTELGDEKIRKQVKEPESTTVG